MKKITLLITWIVLLAGWAQADLLPVQGFGHGFVNTPVAWNSRPGFWHLSATTGFGGDEAADSWGFSALYGKDKWEFGGGLVSFNDLDSSMTYGGQARYTFWSSPNDAYATFLGGAQQFTSDAGDNSTGVFAVLLGQKFDKGGISATFAYWTDVGADSDGNDIGGDLELAANVFFELDDARRWILFGEAYGFSDAEAAGQTVGLIFNYNAQIKLSAAYAHLSDPDDDSRIQLGVHFTLPTPEDSD